MQASPTLRQLKALNAVAVTGSLGGAGAALALTQPAVTQALSKLEAIVGVELIRRTATGSFPSPAGALLVPRIQACLRKIERALIEPYEGRCITTEAQASGLAAKLTDTHLRVLIAIWDAGTAAGAADALHLSKSTLLRSARDLEELLSHDVFKRVGQDLQVNATGAAFAHCVQVALKEIEKGLADLVAFKSTTATRLAIGIVPQYIGMVLFGALEAFIQQFPTSNIELQEGNHDSLVSALLSRKIDILIGNTARPDLAGHVTEHVFFQEDFQVVARLDHPLALLNRDLTIADLASCSWILPPVGTPRRDAFLTLFADLPEAPLVAVETSSPALHLLMLFKSNCLSILTPREVVNEVCYGHGRLAILPSPPLPGVDVKGYMTRADWEPTPRQRQFLDMLEQRADAAAPEQFLKVVQVRRYF